MDDPSECRCGLPKQTELLLLLYLTEVLLLSFYEINDDTFYYIVGYTSGGAPYGVTWEEMGLQPYQSFDDNEYSDDDLGVRTYSWTPKGAKIYVYNLKTKTEEQGLTIQHLKPGDSIDLGSSKIEFYGPITESESDRNNGSIVMKIIYGDTSFLFTGDAEREEEQEILNAGYDLSATVLKVGHHGSKNSTTYPFLREIMPQYAVISVGDNSYGHPTEDTLSRLRDADVKVYRTDMQGDIIATSDGKTVTVTTKKNNNAQTNPTENEKSTSAQSTENAANQEICEYIGNANTKKFHYPDCGAVSQMKEKNKVYLNCTRDEAIKDGYNPCGRCIGK